MRLLAFDHFFQQDLSALSAQLSPDDRLDVIPYQRLHRLARAHFPKEVFTGVEAAYLPTIQSHWRAYVPVAHRFADWLAAAYEPSVFVVPSDAFFYLRPVIERFSSLQVRTVVMQKETTISPMVMEDHSLSIGRTVPFMSDAMTVCSDRHKEFWVRAGADVSRVFVTGQPRFDVYAQYTARQHDGPPVLLYLSYDDTAYLPSDTGVPFEGTWRALRRETEQVLASLASTGPWTITAKLHPQQRDSDDWLGSKVRRADRNSDTRELIIEADAVVGFQTTALFEAAVVGKPVVYAAWGPVFEATRHLLLPFDEQPALATHAAGPDQLSELLREGPSRLSSPGPDARTVAEEQLGPVDGRAAERVLGILRGHAGRGPQPKPRPSIGQHTRAATVGVLAPALSAGALLLDATGRPALADIFRRRRHYWEQEGSEGRRIILGDRSS